MQVEKEFFFQDECENDGINVRIPEIVDPQYGMFTWPAAPVLAHFIWKNKEHFKGKQVIEVEYYSKSASKFDKEEYPQCLENCQRSCDVNGQKSIKVMGITWGQFTPNLFKLPKVDIILGSDCFYDTKDFDDILATVSFLIEKNTEAKFWTTYQERSSSRSIENLLKKWGLRGVEIPLEHFNADEVNIGGSHLSDSHTIHMLEITTQQAVQDAPK
ncbi:Histone-arginine methyltransferase METTL23 [Acropora cervicornis]|uniref:Histone-arginine methyltransferase METTL23 n=1 Tax=Acropora cervicornis TaxID=6130 RepID=A0AAD9Q9B5_ACRCE|nr:Histone-arginine methyltransferase METTL23 [Acropora cervicornis]